MKCSRDGPYDGESPVAVALKHINGGAPMPSTINPNIPGGLEQIIMHAMEVDPARRYSSATEMLYDMEEFRKNPTSLYFDEPVQARAAAPVGGGSLSPSSPCRPAPRSTAERVAGPRQEQPRARGAGASLATRNRSGAAGIQRRRRRSSPGGTRACSLPLA